MTRSAPHLERLQQMPKGKPLSVAQLKELWHVTNAWPTIRYLLAADLCEWERAARPYRSVAMFVFTKK